MMERLTSPTLKQHFKHCVAVWPDELLREEYWRAYDRLAAYEDLGTLADFSALVKAKEEGRISPCKLGDIVWIAFDKKVDYASRGIYKGKVYEINAYNGRTRIGISIADSWFSFGYPFEDVGKAVFFTEQEAQAALERRKEKS